MVWGQQMVEHGHEEGAGGVEDEPGDPQLEGEVFGPSQEEVRDYGAGRVWVGHEPAGNRFPELAEGTGEGGDGSVLGKVFDVLDAGGDGGAVGEREDESLDGG